MELWNLLQRNYNSEFRHESSSYSDTSTMVSSQTCTEPRDSQVGVRYLQVRVHNIPKFQSVPKCYNSPLVQVKV